MVDMNTGTVVIKTVGREAGKIAVVVKKVDDNFVLVTGPKLLTGVKRRKVNLIHIEPTQHRLEIKDDASDEEVVEAFKKSGLVNKLNLRFPSAAQMKTSKEAADKKAAKTEVKAEKPKKIKKAAEEKKE